MKKIIIALLCLVSTHLMAQINIVGLKTVDSSDLPIQLNAISGAYGYFPIDEYDTIRVIMMVSDTAHHISESFETDTAEEGKYLNDTGFTSLFEYGKIVKKDDGFKYNMRHVWWAEAYEVRQKYTYYGDRFMMGEDYSDKYIHKEYLNFNKLPLPKTTIVWMAVAASK